LSQTLKCKGLLIEILFMTKDHAIYLKVRKKTRIIIINYQKTSVWPYNNVNINFNETNCKSQIMKIIIIIILTLKSYNPIKWTKTNKWKTILYIYWYYKSYKHIRPTYSYIFGKLLHTENIL